MCDSDLWLMAEFILMFSLAFSLPERAQMGRYQAAAYGLVLI